MGPITDRTREILGAGDIAIVRFRRMMLQAADALGAGGPTLGIGTSVPRTDIRAHEGMVRKGTEWRTLAVGERERATFHSTAVHDQEAEVAAS
jgi:phthalate 4,5-dioxygenase oxygenase subunit